MDSSTQMDRSTDWKKVFSVDGFLKGFGDSMSIAKKKGGDFNFDLGWLTEAWNNAKIKDNTDIFSAPWNNLSPAHVIERTSTTRNFNTATAGINLGTNTFNGARIINLAAANAPNDFDGSSDNLLRVILQPTELGIGQSEFCLQPARFIK